MAKAYLVIPVTFLNPDDQQKVQSLLTDVRKGGYLPGWAFHHHDWEIATVEARPDAEPVDLRHD